MHGKATNPPVRWARRVSPALIRRLYRSDAMHMQDMELADEAGFALYARAQSLIKANLAHDKGIADCPACRHLVQGGEEYACPCGWRMSRKEHHATYKGRQLVAITVVPLAQAFMKAWEQAGTSYAAKMQAIDALIHGFHYELDPTRQNARPAVVNFVDCPLEPSIDLILELAYGLNGHGVSAQMERWLANAATSHLSELIQAKTDAWRARAEAAVDQPREELDKGIPRPE